MTAQPDLWHPPEPLPESATEGIRRTVSRHESQIVVLVPLARELARKVGAVGITVSDLRLYAVQRGLLTGGETGKTLSYLGAVLKRAGLTATDHVRRSVIGRSHGNLQRVWTL